MVGIPIWPIPGVKGALTTVLAVAFQVQLFINCLLASADYDSFFSVMKKEALKLLRQRQLGGNESKATAREEKDAGELGSGEGKVAESRHDLRDEARSYK